MHRYDTYVAGRNYRDTDRSRNELMRSRCTPIERISYCSKGTRLSFKWQMDRNGFVLTRLFLSLSLSFCLFLSLISPESGINYANSRSHFDDNASANCTAGFPVGHKVLMRFIVQRHVFSRLFASLVRMIFRVLTLFAAVWRGEKKKKERER